MKIIYQTETGISIIHPTGEVPIEVVEDIIVESTPPPPPVVPHGIYNGKIHARQ